MELDLPMPVSHPPPRGMHQQSYMTYPPPKINLHKKITKFGK